jgi:GT2 family glycosyltransferase
VTASPPVAIIVVNWNRRDETLACLHSLAQQSYPHAHVMVVDNGSRDGSVAAVRRAHPQVELIEAGDNLGYVGGNNLGWRHAAAQGAQYAWLLNNDTEVAPDALAQLVAAAEAKPQIGIVGPTIYALSPRDQVASAGGMIDWRRGKPCTLFLGEGNAAWNAEAARNAGATSAASRRVDFVSGCALLAKRAVFERVGLLDSRFFAYYEETEWCVRAARAGYEVHHVPRARVWHATPPPGTPASLLVHYYMTRNRLLFLSATGAGARAWLHTLLAEYLRSVVSWSVKPKWRGMRQHRTLTLRAVRDYFSGRLGRAEWLEDL